jgi:hypothetical protein
LNEPRHVDCNDAPRKQSSNCPFSYRNTFRRANNNKLFPRAWFDEPHEFLDGLLEPLDVAIGNDPRWKAWAVVWIRSFCQTTAYSFVIFRQRITRYQHHEKKESRYRESMANAKWKQRDIDPRLRLTDCEKKKKKINKNDIRKSPWLYFWFCTPLDLCHVVMLQ